MKSSAFNTVVGKRQLLALKYFHPPDDVFESRSNNFHEIALPVSKISVASKPQKKRGGQFHSYSIARKSLENLIIINLLNTFAL